MKRLPVIVAAVVAFGAVLSTAGLPPQAPAPQDQQAVRHDPVVKCIVAGHFPILDSCVDPASLKAIAQCRAYFRGEGAPTWFSVMSKSHPTRAKEGCFQSILLKPKKKTLTAMEFYFECLSKSASDNRTEDFLARVVDDKSECDKDKLLAAPFSNTGPAGVLGSGPGFVGAAGGLLPAAAAVAGIAAAGGVLVATNDEPTTTTTTNVTTTTTTSTTTTTTSSSSTTTTTTAPLTPNRPPEIVCSIRPDPPEGRPPLTVVMRLCGSRDPDGDELRFEYDFGDGALGGGSCESDAHTYAEGRYTATACVTDRQPDHKRCCTFQVAAVTPAPTPTTTTTTTSTTSTTTTTSSSTSTTSTSSTSTSSTSTSSTTSSTSTTATTTSTTATTTSTTATTTSTTATTTSTTATTTSTTATTTSTTATTTTTLPPCDTIPPTTAITSPLSGTSLSGTSTTITADAADNVSVVVVEFFYKPILFSGGPSSPISIGTDTSAPYSVTWTFPVTCIAYDYELTTVALDNCKNTTTSAVVPVTMSSCGDTAGESRAAFHWSSQLEAPGSAGRVLLNGAMIANGSARQEGLAQAKRDENRVDAELVQGGSRPGVWRFDFSAAVAPGSVRVLAGDALQVSEGAVVFRLTGTTGERVSFVFRARD